MISYKKTLEKYGIDLCKKAYELSQHGHGNISISCELEAIMGVDYVSTTDADLMVLAYKATIRPKVGDGATISYGSDRYPYTVIEVSKSGTRIRIQEDEAVLTNGSPYEDQEWSYSRNKDGAVKTASLRKDGRWRLMGCEIYVYLGSRSRYNDPCF